MPCCDRPDRTFHRNRKRCKACRSEDYFKKRYPAPCFGCARHRELASNGKCRKCCAKLGMRQCGKCQKLLVVVKETFHGANATCEICLGRTIRT